VIAGGPRPLVDRGCRVQRIHARGEREADAARELYGGEFGVAPAELGQHALDVPPPGGHEPRRVGVRTGNVENAAVGVEQQARPGQSARIEKLHRSA